MNKTKQEIFSRNVYLSSFPVYFRFLIFIKQGFFNGGGWMLKKSRVFCWFDKHEYTLLTRSLSCISVTFEEQQKEIEGYELSFYLQCKHCGISKLFEGQYRGYDEHRIILKDHAKPSHNTIIGT